MMKVLFVSSSNKGEITSIVKYQGESLVRCGMQVDYFGIKGKGLFGYLSNIGKLDKHIRVSNPDIIHAHYSLSGMVAGLTGTRKPLLVSLMGSDTQVGMFWRLLIRLFTFFRWDSIIVKSSSIKSHLGIKKAWIIPNGVNLDTVKNIGRSKFLLEDNVILFAADPKRRSKNFTLANKAVSLLNRKDIILRTVHSKPHLEIIKELSYCNLLLVTSRWEGSSNLVKEAMACNCPVVSTNVGDVEWLFGDEPGHYITSFNPEDVANKIKLALEYAKINGKTKGRDRIITLGLDSGTIANKIVQLYNEIAENRK